jgi:hypothetical protein
LAQAIGQAAIRQGYRVLSRETHVLLDEVADTAANGTRKDHMESIATVPLLIIDDFGMRKLPRTAAEDLLEIIMHRYECCSTLLTSNRPVAARQGINILVLVSLAGFEVSTHGRFLGVHRDGIPGSLPHRQMAGNPSKMQR